MVERLEFISPEERQRRQAVSTGQAVVPVVTQPYPTVAYSGTYLTPLRDIPKGTVRPTTPSPYEQYYIEEAQRIAVPEGYRVPTYAEAWEEAQKGVPKGSKILQVTPTTITYLPPTEQPKTWKETTLTGAMYGHAEKGYEIVHDIRGTRDRIVKVAPQTGFVGEVSKFWAGVVAVPESWLHPVPTPTSELIHKAAHLGGGGETAYERGEVSPGYLVGGLFGTATEAWLMGKGVSAAWGVTKKVAWKVAPEATESLARWAKFGPVAKATHEAKLWMKGKLPTWKLPKPFTKHLGTGEITQLSPKQFGQVGLKELEMVEASWQISFAPRMGGVWYKQYPALTKGIMQKYGMETIIRGEAVTKIFRPFREEEFRKIVSPVFIQREATFTPLVSQTMLTRMGVQPYIPKMVSTIARTTRKVATPFIGFSISTVAKLAPKAPERLTPTITAIPKALTWTPTFTFEREKFRPQLLEPKTPKKKERGIVVPKLEVPTAITPVAIPKLEVPTATVPIVKPKQVIVQVPQQKLVFPTPTIPKQTYPKFTAPPFYEMHGGFGGEGRPKSMFGKWFRRTHRIKTPEEMMRTLTGISLKGRRRKR